MRRTLKVLAHVLVAALLAGACSEKVSEDDNPLAGSTDIDESEVDEEIDEPLAPTEEPGQDIDVDPNAVVEAAILDVQDFWSRSFEDLYGEPYEEISGGFYAYGPDTAQPPCGDPAPSYEDIAQNAFYCPSDDLIAWDEVNLVPGMFDQFGPFTLGIIFAHEFGHAIQTRAGVAGSVPTLVTELQADCFAGAWTADVDAGNAQYFTVDVNDLEASIAGFLELRDGIGVDPLDDSAHGAAFDRIGAYQDGFENGLEKCATYIDAPPRPVEFAFTDPDDFDRGGNLPLEEIVPLAVTDLEDFYSVLFGELGLTWAPLTDVVPVDSGDTVSCGGTDLSGEDLAYASFFCIDDGTIYIDNEHLVPELDEIGDFAVAAEIARNYAFAAEVQAGVEGDALALNLYADCLTGLWAFTTFPDATVRAQTRSLVLSPGDLDEAVIAFLTYGDTPDEVEAGSGTTGTAFQRVRAMRSGFYNGVEACDSLL